MARYRALSACTIGGGVYRRQDDIFEAPYIINMPDHLELLEATDEEIKQATAAEKATEDDKVAELAAEMRKRGRPPKKEATADAVNEEQRPPQQEQEGV